MPDPQRYDLFTVTEAEGRWEIRPSAPWAPAGAFMSAAGGAFCLYIGGMFLAGGNYVATLAFAALFFVVAASLLWQAWGYWRLRRTPLVVGENGRLTYDARELCPAAAATRVQIAPDPGAEHPDDCTVLIETKDGQAVALPLPYFGAVGRRDVARDLAEVLARALGTEVIELPSRG